MAFNAKPWDTEEEVRLGGETGGGQHFNIQVSSEGTATKLPGRASERKQGDCHI